MPLTAKTRPLFNDNRQHAYRAKPKPPRNFAHAPGAGTGGKNMAELGPKNKDKVSAKSLANLRPNPQHLKPHGEKQSPSVRHQPGVRLPQLPAGRHPENRCRPLG